MLLQRILGHEAMVDAHNDAGLRTMSIHMAAVVDKFAHKSRCAVREGRNLAQRFATGGPWAVGTAPGWVCRGLPKYF